MAAETPTKKGKDKKSKKRSKKSEKADGEGEGGDAATAMDVVAPLAEEAPEVGGKKAKGKKGKAKGKKRKAAAPMLDEQDVRINATCKFLDTMFELVPARYYFNTIHDTAAELHNKYSKNTKQKAPKQDVKMLSKKAKKRKLDPAQHRTNKELLLAGHDFDQAAEQANLPMEALRERMQSRMQTLRAERKSTGAATPRHDRPRSKEGRAVVPAQSRAQAEAQDMSGAESDSSASGGEAGAVAAAAAAGDEAEFEFRLHHAGETKLNNQGHREEVGAKKKKKLSDRDLLKKAEKFERRLEGAETRETREALEEGAAWNAAMDRAEGVKVRDDSKLIKKSIKRKEQQKKKSQKQWAARIADQKQRVLEEKKKKQEKQERRAKKGKKSNSKDRPGFEGNGTSSSKGKGGGDKKGAKVFDNRNSKKKKPEQGGKSNGRH